MQANHKAKNFVNANTSKMSFPNLLNFNETHLFAKDSIKVFLYQLHSKGKHLYTASFLMI